VKIVRDFLLPSLAVTASLSVLWYVHLPVPAVQSSMEQVRQEAQDGGYRLIDVESLRALYQTRRDEIRLVDTRQEWEYRAGHIEGSVNYPIEPTWWSRWRGKSDLKALLGPDKEKTVVFY
jgi:hypothetical protein